MRCDVDEIADGIYRIATHLDGFGSPTGIEFCQFLVKAEQPMLFHTGMRSLWPDIAAAVARLVRIDALRWVSFGHVEGDECGALGEVLAAALHAEVAFGGLGCAVTVNDLAGGRTRPLAPGAVLDLGGRRMRHLPTPHVPHNWEAQLFYEEVTGTLFCGDLLAQVGRGVALTEDLAIVETALAVEVGIASAAPGPALPDTVRSLAELEPTTLAVMHGSSFAGTGGDALRHYARAWQAGFALRVDRRDPHLVGDAEPDR